MKILLASNNKKKLIELKATLGPKYEIFTLKDLDIVSEPEEDGATFEENALIKARAGFEASGLPCIADDSGLCVDALGGAPGIFSARYAGVHGNDEDNNDLLLKNLEDKADRRGRFVCAAAFVSKEAETVVRGECEGIIAKERAGNGGFGYDPLFFLPQYGKTMAEITAEEKNSISHRGKAISLLKEKLDGIYGL